MSRRAAQTLARAILRGAYHHHQNVGPRVYRATITSLSPLGLDLLAVDLTLDDEDVELSQSVTAYDQTTGLQIGDELVLNEVEDGDFVAVSVITDTTS